MIKQGDKVVCINDSTHLNGNITIGKVYEIENCDDVNDNYIIKNDLGKRWVYNSRLFVSIDEYRDGQIKKLFDE